MDTAYDGDTQPLEVGSSITEAFRALGANFGIFGIIAAIVVVPGSLVGLVLTVAMQDFNQAWLASITQGGSPDFSQFAWLAPVWLLVMTVYMALYAIGQAAAMYATIEHLVGRKASLGDALKVGLSRFLPLFACSFLVGLITGVGAMFCIVPGVIAWIWLSVALPAVTMEGVGPIAGMQRSIELTEGHRLTIFVVYFVLFIAYMGFSMCIVGPASLMAAGGLAPGELPDPLAPAQLVVTALNVVIQMIVFMVATAIASVIYARLRGLREGVDAGALAKVFS